MEKQVVTKQRPNIGGERSATSVEATRTRETNMKETVSVKSRSSSVSVSSDSGKTAMVCKDENSLIMTLERTLSQLNKDIVKLRTSTEKRKETLTLCNKALKIDAAFIMEIDDYLHKEDRFTNLAKLRNTRMQDYNKMLIEYDKQLTTHEKELEELKRLEKSVQQTQRDLQNIISRHSF